MTLSNRIEDYYRQLSNENLQSLLIYYEQEKNKLANCKDKKLSIIKSIEWNRNRIITNINTIERILQQRENENNSEMSK